MSKFKTYWKDYMVAQKACNEFNKKHWLGNIILCVVVWLLSFGGLFAYYKIKDKKDENACEDED